MQRTIKFRTWYGGKMHRWGIFGREADVSLTFIPPIDLFSPQMQFTGLLDKNGKEIYEGDILDCKAKSDYPNDTARKAVFFGDDLGFVADNDSRNFGLHLTWGGYKSLEVIGNIYENPTLVSGSIS